MTKWKNKFRYAFNGLKILIADHSVITQLVNTALALFIAALLRFSFGEIIVVLIFSAMVVVAECINSCLEKTADALDPEKDREKGQIKDMGAGMVLVTALFALITGIILVIRHL